MFGESRRLGNPGLYGDWEKRLCRRKRLGKKEEFTTEETEERRNSGEGWVG
jgi:hypothetical protein